MNFTLYAFAATLISQSSMIQIAPTYKVHRSYNFNAIKLHHFHQSFISSYTSNYQISIFKSSFKNFLNSAINIHSETITKKPINKSLDFTDTEIIIDECIFSDCNRDDKPNSNGGAIYYECSNGELTVHGTIFENCETNGDGGAIFAVGKKGTTNDINIKYSHENMNKINSHYCCYSHCTAKCNEQGDYGYGSALFFAANDIELNYSSTNECPQNTKAYGAQIDLNTTDVKSCYINATTGNSHCCGSIEYRKAESGFFRYQTIVDQTCAFGTSFTSINGPIDISYCNMVNNTLDSSKVPSLALVYVILKSVTIQNFIVVGTKIIGTDKSVGFAMKENQTSNEYHITVAKCTLDEVIGQSKYLNGITTLGEIKTLNNAKTHELSLLNLDNCVGGITPPPRLPTNSFSNSDAFTQSKYFSKSNVFTKTQYFTYTNAFTQSNYFSKSNDFTQTQLKHFTQSQSFSNSVAVVDKGGDLTENEKDNKKNLIIIGAAVGAAAAIAIIILVVLLVLRKKRLNIVDDEANVVPETNSSVTVDNNLNNMMKNDDPFAADFNIELEDMKHDEK